MSGTVRRAAAILCLFLSPLLVTSARAATITVSSATVARAHQDQARLCVGLEVRAGEQIAGTENLLLWDGECATMIDGSCVASAHHGKDLSGTLQRQRDFSYKGLVLSFSNTDPIAAGELYCCEFLVHARPGDCCSVRVGSPGGSDPNGNSLPVSSGPPGRLCVASDGSGSRAPVGGGPVGGFAPGGAVPGAGGEVMGGRAPAAGVPGFADGLFGGGVPSAGDAIAMDGADSLPGAQEMPQRQVPADDPASAAVADDLPVVAPPAVEPPVVAPPAVEPPAAAPPVPPRTAQDDTAPAAKPGDVGSASSPAQPAVEDSGSADEMRQADADTAVADADSPAATPRPRVAAEAVKPSPRDVSRERSAVDAAGPRRFPLDDDGCQVTAFGRAPELIVLPLLVLLLGRRRRRI